MEPITALTISTVAVTGSIITGLSIYFWKQEKKAWNNGNCPHCNKPWKFIGFDEHADSRVYTCGKHVCEISFKSIINKKE